LQSRDAAGISSAFLNWLTAAGSDRPFFAFLNYFDAHDPYIPPQRYAGRFGIRPRTRAEFEFLSEFRDVYGKEDKDLARKIYMARDCYDDCVAYLDDQLGRLLEALRVRGVLDNTLVIITSDHGEAFGDHFVYLHGTGLYMDQIAVPLVMLAPKGPAGITVTTPVSLRDLPATVVDQLDLSAGSPFPGYSLASLWSTAPGQPPAQITPALTELAHANAFKPQPQATLSREGFQMSLVAPGWHYVRDGTGSEQLFDLKRDRYETVNLAESAEAGKVLEAFRRKLLQVLTENPGSVEVEDAYLKPFKKWLQSLVQSKADRVKPVAALDAR
jgi:arylsulfatase A-like enzyme